MQDPRKRLEEVTTGGAIVGVVSGIAFFGIGLAVLFFMWSGDGGFHDPPIFFKIFASLIALPFVAVGATIAVGSFKVLTAGENIASTINQLKDAATDEMPQAKSGRAAYVCPRCGSPLAETPTSHRTETLNAATAVDGLIFTRPECRAAKCLVTWWSCRTGGVLLSQPHDELFENEAGAVA